MVVVFETLDAVHTLITLLWKAVRLADELRSASRHASDVAQQLRTLANVLEHVEREFKRTLDVVSDTGGDLAGLDAIRKLLEKCISDCTITCRQHHSLLNDIAISKWSAMKWKRYQGEFNRLHTTLEARKSTLMTLMPVIREFADNQRRARPPPYSALVSAATTKVAGSTSMSEGDSQQTAWSMGMAGVAGTLILTGVTGAMYFGAKALGYQLSDVIAIGSGTKDSSSEED